MLNMTDSLLNTIFSNPDYTKVISFILLLHIIFVTINEPSTIILILFSNKYYVIMYLLFVFYISLYNPFISFLLAIIYCIVLDKLYKFKLIIEKQEGGGRRNKEQHHINRGVLSYFLT
tara:strand:+ start:351 stop:704 length:354 start_codon:yes stop_codon:yes gene_type:complete